MAGISKRSIDSSPPSSWPLDYVPGHILDKIVDYVAQDAVESDFYDVSGTSSEQERIGYGLIPFSSDLKNMSLVNRAFRENVIRRKVMELVILDSSDRVKIGLTSIRKESFPYIRRLVLGSISMEQFLTNAEWDAKLGFLEKCPALRDVIDHTEHLAYTGYPFLPTTSCLALTLATAEKEKPLPLTVPELQDLCIWVPDPSRRANFTLEAALKFQTSVHTLCQHLKAVKSLHLHSPGVGAARTNSPGELPAELRMPDYLGSSFEKIDHFHLTTNYQVRCENMSNEEVDVRWDYYSWLLHTAPEIKHIEITMLWRRCNGMYNRNLTVSEILDQIGLTVFEAEDLAQPRPYTRGEAISPSVRGFFDRLFEARQGLEKITLNYASDFSWGQNPLRFRTITASRMDNAKIGQITAVCDDTIFYDLLDRSLREITGSVGLDAGIFGRIGGANMFDAMFEARLALAHNILQATVWRFCRLDLPAKSPER